MPEREYASTRELRRAERYLRCFMQARVAALVLIGMGSCSQPLSRTTAMTVCELSRDSSAYRNRMVAVRGVYFNGLRQHCPQTCAIGPWPSFVDLVGSDTAGDAIWADLAKAALTAEQEAKHGRRVEVWVTVKGNLKASERRSPVGPCDRAMSRGFGHLGMFPALIVAESLSDIQLIPNADSAYDYGHGYRGAL